MSIELHCCDCLEFMRAMPDKSVDLIIADPPYNIGKASWDRIKNYIDWCGVWITECQRILANNGSMYIFHNDMEQISDLVLWIRNNTPFVFKQMIVWNKRFDEAKNKGFLDGFIVPEGLRNYQKMAEYILYYTLQDDNGLTTVMLDTNNFSSLRQYFKDYQEALELSKIAILELIGQQADHCFRWGSSQWDMPTEETYNELAKLPINNEFMRREYEDLRREYEDLRYTFNNQKTHHSVWNYEIAKGNGHETPKPVDLIKNIILHSSNVGDLIYDPFAGRASIAEACIKTNRNYIGTEFEKSNYSYGLQRIHDAEQQMRLGI
jgi:site-specific DNA-methyltransferase (adenine-specific)